MNMRKLPRLGSIGPSSWQRLWKKDNSSKYGSVKYEREILAAVEQLYDTSQEYCRQMLQQIDGRENYCRLAMILKLKKYMKNV
ncbi:MAG: hypothetical protein HFI71_05520 [Lachnospiraceae bacterium]|nr:hypothetical protein [Lachnospiraceae bacterium]